MTYLDESSLPEDLRCKNPPANWRRAKKDALAWLNVKKLPPVSIREGLIAPELVVELLFSGLDMRAVLKKHATPDSLDQFVAAFCRQAPDDGSAHNHFGFLGKELGGRETLKVMIGVIKERQLTRDSGYLHGAASCVAALGDATCIPAMVLRGSRLDPKENRMMHWWVNNKLAELCKRIGISGPDFEDWSVPDEGERDEITHIRQQQTERLQKAMSTDRRWTVDMFERRIVHQRMVSPLAAGLLWGYFDDAGRLVQPFLLEPDLTFPGAPVGAAVGIVHPAHLSASEAAIWRKRTEDRCPPFEQWIPVNTLPTEQLESDRIAQLPEVKLPAATLLCRLEALGWLRTKNDGTLRFHMRPFPEMGISAVIGYTGIPLTYGGEWTDQSIDSCIFVANKQQLRLSEVSPIAISAVLDDLEALRLNGSRGKSEKKRH